MDLEIVKEGESLPFADVVIEPFFQDQQKSSKLSKAVKEDFKGKLGELLLLYPGPKQPRLLLLGLGVAGEASCEHLRIAFSKATRFCRKKELLTVVATIPHLPTFSVQESTNAVVEGVALTNYLFEQYKKKSSPLIKRLYLVGASPSAQQTLTICQAVLFTRDLVNQNADEVTPSFLGEVAKKLCEESSYLTASILDAEQIKKEKMGLLLAVSRGASTEPKFIVLRYQASKSKDCTVLVGKGVTFDSGGLNIKPASNMEHQRSDMAGAAAILGVMRAICALNLSINVMAVIPATENSIGSKSYKQGDVYTAYDGTTVEIGNTDAEGRLILADALSYVVKNLQPTRIIDLATLTGAVVVALGDEIGGLFSNSDELASSLHQAGESSYERLCRLPLVKQYNCQLLSNRADLKNVGGGGAGAILAALFLENFVKDVPWAHIDIAGTRYVNEERSYRPKGATGFGVRLLVNYLQNRADHS